ncbi:hypothetical protein AAG906_009813 [Vitis piasezkii]|uniref:Uncharacterized protein n=2 Tax=Vitis vinifera TaxID=29760 RepID=A0A438E0K9_VITVI
MCMCPELLQSLPRCSTVFRGRRLKRFNVQVRRLNRMRSRRTRKESKDKAMMVVGVKSEMEIKNWKLYMLNQSIIQENEKLRMKALLLHQENQALLSQLQNKFKTSPHNNNH